MRDSIPSMPTTHHHNRAIPIAFLFFCLFAIAATVFTTTTRLSAMASSTATLSLPEYEFTLQHPKAWSIEKDPQADGALNVFVSSEAEQYFTTITLAKDAAALPPSALEDLAKETLAALQEDGSTITVLKTQKGKLAGVATKTVTLTQKTTDGTLLKDQLVFFVKGKMAYVLTLVSTPEQYNKNARSFSNVLKSVALGSPSAKSSASSGKKTESIKGIASLNVTVKTKLGAPVKNVEVDVGKKAGPPPIGGVAKTNEKGIATFFVKPGNYVIYFNDNTFPAELKAPASPKKVRVTAGAPVDATITLESK